MARCPVGRCGRWPHKPRAVAAIDSTRRFTSEPTLQIQLQQLAAAAAGFCLGASLAGRRAGLTLPEWPTNGGLFSHRLRRIPTGISGSPDLPGRRVDRAPACGCLSSPSPRLQGGGVAAARHPRRISPALASPLRPALASPLRPALASPLRPALASPLRLQLGIRLRIALGIVPYSMLAIPLASMLLFRAVVTCLVAFIFAPGMTGAICFTLLLALKVAWLLALQVVRTTSGMDWATGTSGSSGLGSCPDAATRYRLPSSSPSSGRRGPG